MTHLKTGIWANINYPTSGMRCCRTCWLSAYSNPPSSSTSPLALTPSPNKRGHNHTYSSFGKYVPLGCLLPPTSTLTSYNQSLAQFPPQQYVHPRGVHPLYLPTFWHILVPYFPPKLVSIVFSIRPEEALLVLTLQKLVWIYFHYLQI